MTHLGSPFWVPSRALQAHLNRTATGRPDDDWLSMMLSGLATEPWLTEMVKLGSDVDPEPPPVVAQTTTPTTTARTSAAAP